MVRFVSYRDLRNTPAKVWQALKKSDAIALTANGTPRAIMFEIEEGNLEGALQVLRRVRAQLALSRVREESANRGTDRLSTEEIDKEIRVARNARTR